MSQHDPSIRHITYSQERQEWRLWEDDESRAVVIGYDRLTRVGRHRKDWSYCLELDGQWYRGESLTDEEDSMPGDDEVDPIYRLHPSTEDEATLVVSTAEC